MILKFDTPSCWGREQIPDEVDARPTEIRVTDWTNYIRKDHLFTTPAPVFGLSYGAQTVDQIPQVPASDYSVLSDVASTGFWSPYGP